MKTDEAIKREIIEQLFWDDRVNASHIKVDISDGNVTLTGNVPNYNSLRAALEDTYSLREVVSVINNLAVEYPGTQSLPTDLKLKTNIEGILLMNSSIDPSGITVTVHDGVATVDGSVDSYWKKLKISELALDVTGIKDVVYRVSVVPTNDFFDKAIAQDIINALERNVFIDVNNVDVKVNDGVVTLSGTVQDWRSVYAVLNIVNHTSGVLDVKNQLLIARK